MKQIMTSLIILISPINLYAWGGSWGNESWGNNSQWGEKPLYYKWRKKASAYDNNIINLCENRSALDCLTNMKVCLKEYKRSEFFPEDIEEFCYTQVYLSCVQEEFTFCMNVVSI